MDPRAERRLNWAIALGALLLAPVLGLLVFIAADRLYTATIFGEDEVSVDCDEFEFDSRSWIGAGEQEREEIATHLAECGTLEGLSQPEVKRMLGPHGREPQRRTDRTPKRTIWTYSAGWTNDALGPGDGQVLVVPFGPDGRVHRAHLLLG